MKQKNPRGDGHADPRGSIGAGGGQESVLSSLFTRPGHICQTPPWADLEKGTSFSCPGQSRSQAWCREHGGLPPLALESRQGPQLSFILVHPVRQGNMTFCPPGRPH